MCSQSPLCSPIRGAAAEVEAGADLDAEDEFTISYHVSLGLNP